MGNQTTTIEKTFTLEEILDSIGLNSKLILHNDDVNTFEWVIECLVKYCEHNEYQAEQCAWIVHTKGKCTVKEGSKDSLKPLKEALQEAGLHVTLE